MQIRSFKWAAAAPLFVAATVQAAPAPYHITNISVVQIGTLGGNESVAMDVNDEGDIVGWSLDANGRKHAFRYLHSTGLMEDISPGNMIEGEAHGINNHGATVGFVNQLFGSVPHAFYYNGVQPMFLLEEWAGRGCTPGSKAHAINDDGIMTGDAYFFCGAYLNLLPVRWASDTMPWLNLVNLGGGSAYAHNINSAGVIVGDDPTGGVTDSGGWSWDPTSGTDGLEIPKGTPPEVYWSYQAKAFGINSAGQMVGEMPMRPQPDMSALEYQRAIFWPPKSQPALIYTLFGDGKNAGAREINDINLTVGWADRTLPLMGLQKRAAAWTTIDSITMLPLPPGVTDGTMRSPTVCEALAVGNSGFQGLIHAVGYCEIEGRRKAMLWNITVSQIQVAPHP